MKVFLSYAHADIESVASIKSMLDELQRDDKITLFHDGEIRAGQLFDAEIEGHLRRATHFLLAISDDYIKSDYVRKKELPIIKNRIEAGGAKVFPLLIKGVDWSHFVESDRAGFLKDAQFWPIVNGHPIPICDLPVHDRVLQILRLRKHLLKKRILCEEIDDTFWAADQRGIPAYVARLKLADSVDLQAVSVQLPTYLAEIIEVDAVATLVSKANGILYEIDAAAFPKRKIVEPSINFSPDEEEDYWSGIFVSLSERSPLSIVTLLALIYRQAPSVRKSIERIIKASEEGATS